MKYKLDKEFFGPFAWGCYVEGYGDSVHSLFNSIITKGEKLNKNELLPLLFLIRHYIELNLKEVISHEKYLHESLNQNIEHDLLKLWSKSKPKIIELINTTNNSMKYRIPNKDKLSLIEEFINYIYNIDPSSYCFRYPFKTDFESPYFESIEIDINNIYNNFKIVNVFFTNIQAFYMTNDKYYK